MLDPTVSVIGELENALKDGSSDKRVETLRRVTDLFLDDADRLNEQQIKLFDDVLIHLIQRIETKALVRLSESLAPADNAPPVVIRHLARHDEITIAGPVLMRSNRLSDDELIQIAESRGQHHLLAIARRHSINHAVTDVLLRRGNREVGHELTQNPGASFSENGFAALEKHAETDEDLAEKLGQRLDVPSPLLRALLSRATDAVRSRLLATAPPEALEQIRRTLASIAEEVAREANGPRDFARATNLVQEINRSGKLNESVVSEFATRRCYEEIVSALALLTSTPVHIIERLMKNLTGDGIVIACKAAGLKWPTVSIILRNRFSHHSVPESDIAAAKGSFLALSQATAQRTLRFWQTQEAARQAS